MGIRSFSFVLVGFKLWPSTIGRTTSNVFRLAFNRVPNIAALYHETCLTQPLCLSVRRLQALPGYDRVIFMLIFEGLCGSI